MRKLLTSFKIRFKLSDDSDRTKQRCKHDPKYFCDLAVLLLVTKTNTNNYH